MGSFEHSLFAFKSYISSLIYICFVLDKFLGITASCTISRTTRPDYVSLVCFFGLQQFDIGDYENAKKEWGVGRYQRPDQMAYHHFPPPPRKKK